jgi:hypothetical protein
MQTEPISVKEALARFKRTRPAVEPPPPSTILPPQSSSTSDELWWSSSTQRDDLAHLSTTISTSSNGRVTGATILAATIGTTLLSGSIANSTSSSSFSAKDEVRILKENQQRQQKFSISNNLYHILKESKPTFDQDDCCHNEQYNLNCCHSDSCSACTESTASSSESEEEKKKNIPGFGWAKKQKLKSNQQIVKAEAKKEKVQQE